MAADKPTSRHVFLELDAMRGVAAACVMLYHYGPFLSAGKVLPGAYLAVDLFFLLSGFIIAHAYEARLQAGMGFARFAVIRLIRLYPLYLLGLTIGLLYMLGRDLLMPGRTTLLPLLANPLMLSLLMLPNLSQVMPLGGMYPFDGAAWSLMFEMLINLAYGAACLALDARRLRWIVGIGAVGLALSALGFGSLDVGMTPRTLPGGLARVTFSFALGICLYHIYRRRAAAGRSMPQPRFAFELVLVLLVCVFAIPAAGTARLATDLVCVLVFFPLVIWLGAQLPSPAWLRPAYAEAGRLSYAIYILHAPLVLMYAGAFKLIWHADPSVVRPYGGLLFAALSLLAAALAVRLVDEPVRRRLGRLLNRPATRPHLASAHAGKDWRHERRAG